MSILGGAAPCNAGNIAAAHVGQCLHKGHLGARNKQARHDLCPEMVGCLETELGFSHLGGSLGQRSWTAWGYS